MGLISYELEIEKLRASILICPSSLNWKNYASRFRLNSVATYKSRVQRQPAMSRGNLVPIEVAREDEVLHAKPHYVEDLEGYH